MRFLNLFHKDIWKELDLQNCFKMIQPIPPEVQTNMNLSPYLCELVRTAYQWHKGHQVCTKPLPCPLAGIPARD